MPRIPPITGKDDVPAEHHDVVDDVSSVFGRMRGPFSMLLHSPKLASKMLPMVRSTATRRSSNRHCASPRSSRRCASGKAAYVWAAQVAAAQRGRAYRRR